MAGYAQNAVHSRCTHSPISFWHLPIVCFSSKGLMLWLRRKKPRRVVDLNSTEEFRIRKAEEMLQRHGPAISKSNGHTHTFRAALALVDGFNLPEDIAFELLLKWNATCLPPWSEEDLHRKLREAMRR